MKRKSHTYNHIHTHIHTHTHTHIPTGVNPLVTICTQDYPDIVASLKSMIESYRRTMVEPVITRRPNKSWWDQTVDYWQPLN